MSRLPIWYLIDWLATFALVTALRWFKWRTGKAVMMTPTDVQDYHMSVTRHN